MAPHKSFRNGPRQGAAPMPTFLVIVLLCAVGYGVWYWFSSSKQTVSYDDLILHEVTKGSFDHIVLEQGEIESSSNMEVLCQVKAKGSGGTPILWVIDEGTAVTKGQLIVQLDKSALEDEVQAQRILVNSAKAKLISSEALLEQSKIARTEYLEGTYLTEEKTILSEIAVAEQELRKAQLASLSTERLVAKGLVKSLQLEADQFAVANAKNKLEGAQGRLKVLQELTQKKMLVQFDSEIEKSKAQVASDRSILEEEEGKLADLNKQLSACDIYAPADGVVVYSNRYSSRGGSAEFVVEAGAMVREQQSIVKLPDPSRMQVKAKVSEGRITLVQDGMPVKIRVDAIPGLELLGRVTKVNRYAEPGGWFSSQIKEYAAIVQILNPPSEIRTGMTAEVRIFVDQRPDAVQIPVQGIYEHGGKTFTLVKKGNDFDTRLVSIAATNDTAAAIADGLEVGEQIVLDLRNHLNLMTLPTIERVAESKPLSELVEAQGGKFVPAKKGEGPSIGGQVDGPSRTGAAGGGTAPGGSVPGDQCRGAQRPEVAAPEVKAVPLTLQRSCNALSISMTRIKTASLAKKRSVRFPKNVAREPSRLIPIKMVRSHEPS